MQFIALAFEVFEKIIDPVERLVALPQQLLGGLLEKLLNGTRQVHALSVSSRAASVSATKSVPGLLHGSMAP